MIFTTRVLPSLKTLKEKNTAELYVFDKALLLKGL
jgi:hypothetical protein